MDIRKLSSREEEVLFALADGLSTKEIANEFNLNYHTIKNYIKTMVEALGATNRTHAVALAYHTGLLIPRQLT